jgi:RNA-directed DNA polymerase
MHPSFRFYSLWDKVWRADVLREAWRRSRANGGAPGVDGIGFREIEDQGVEQWLGDLQQELLAGTYQPQPLLRVWIPKRNGKQRPLSIPTVRDRVVQTAMVIVLSAVFEPDLPNEQHGFRPGRSAKTALQAVHEYVSRRGRTEVVDADLASYFDTIPHGRLMRCLSRRVSDGQVLRTIKLWLVAPVVERGRKLERRNASARRRSRGTPQGGALSPLLAREAPRSMARAVHRRHTDEPSNHRFRRTRWGGSNPHGKIRSSGRGLHLLITARRIAC